MTIKNLSQRLGRLEALGSGEELGWGDLCEMVARQIRGEITEDSAEYLAFIRRPLKPWLAKVMAEGLARIEALRAEKAEEWAALDARNQVSNKYH
jgi:hypothetical protein